MAIDTVKGLLTYTNHITLITGGKKLSISKNNLNFIKKNNIVLIEEKIINCKFSNKKITMLTYDTSFKFDTIYLGMGKTINCKIFKNLNVKINNKHQIKVNAKQKTNVPGVYAVGDVCNELAQLSTAFGSAATAAVSIHQYLFK